MPVALLVAGLFLVPVAAAQPVHKFVSVQAPARTVATDLSQLLTDKRPRLALYRSEQTATYVGGNPRLVEDAVYFWELLLLGLRIPYEIVDDRAISGRLDRDWDIVVMPVAEALSDRQKRRLREYVEDGGNLIVSGRFGVFDEEGNRKGGDFFRSMLGSEYVENVPSQPFGYLQSLTGRGPVSAGVDPGFQLNVAAQQPLVAARPVEALGLGRVVTYQPADQAAFDSLTTAVYNHKEDGRVLWTRFHAHEISREDIQQYMWQRLVVNAMVDMVGGLSVSVAPWPNAAPMALSVAALPTVGFDPLSFMNGTEQLLDLLETARVPASFYLTSSELSALNDLRNRLIGMGEVGLTAESDRVLKGQPMEIQRERILRAKRDMGIETFHGIYPPGGFFDGNTLRVLDDLSVDYLILPGLTSWSPGEVDWWEYVDYRETIEEAEVPEEPQLALFVPGQETAARSNAPEPPAPRVEPDRVISVSIIDGVAPSFEETYRFVRDVNGHYVLPYYPETYSARSTSAADFERTIARARKERAWIATVSDAVIWWRQRQSIRPLVVSRSGQELHIDVHNDSESVVDGAVLEIKMGGESFRNMRVAGGDGVARFNEDTGVMNVHLPTLDIGVRRVVLTWDRR